jgi:glycosyltransferase involved in cell wall biosynthesis
VALVHDFFVQDGGAERCALELFGLFDRAPVYTTFFDGDTFGDRVSPERVRTWPLQRPLGGRRFRSLLPLYPLYFSTLDLRHAELVLSSSVAFAKAVRTSRNALHVSYIHTPMRYAWGLDEYLRRSSYPLPIRLATRVMRPALARWDRRTSRRPDVLVANSQTVRRRIRAFWGREAEVIHPPVNVDEFKLSNRDDGFLLVASRLLAYRRLDLAVAAARRLGRKLVVVGNGPERRRLEGMAGPVVRFLGHLPRAQLVDLFERCHAYVLPGEEDFGISPVEAMAAGKPVIAFARGGATETVIDGTTGILFARQSVNGIVEAIERLDSLQFDSAAIREHACQYDRHVFLDSWRALLDRLGVDRSLYKAAS